MYFVDDYSFAAGIQYNFGVRLWSSIILVIFGYVWITNIGLYTSYYSGLQQKLTGFGMHIVAEILPPEKIAEGVKNSTASILQWNQQMK